MSNYKVENLTSMLLLANIHVICQQKVVKLVILLKNFKKSLYEHCSNATDSIPLLIKNTSLMLPIPPFRSSKYFFVGP